MQFKKNYFFFLVLILSLYFSGFAIREISNGAAHTDLSLHIWIIIQDFKINFDNTLINYFNYDEGTFPFFHIIQSKFNPFTNSIIEYTLSNTVFNLLIILIFIFFIKKRKIFSHFISLYIPLILLISPWFRSTSFWGTTENFALIFIIPALYYFEKIIKSNIFEKKDNLYLLFFLTLATYSRQQYFFLVIAHFLIIAIKYKQINKILFNSFFYFCLGLPAFYIFFFKWGIYENITRTTSNSNHLSFTNIFNNFFVISSILFFYLVPIIILNYKKFLKLISLKNIIIFFLIFVSMYLILFQSFKFPSLGGGFFLKFDKIILQKSYLSTLFTGALLLTIIIATYKKKFLDYYIILLSLYSWFGLISFIYQEWFDPLYLIAIFLLIPANLIEELNLNKKVTFIIFFGFEIIILIIAILYYHVYLKVPFFLKFI